MRFLAVNSNDADRYPADSPEAMAERYDAEQWGMPYLHDASQDVATAYGARTTPDLFVFDADLRLRYRGAPDSDYRDPAQGAAWLRSALEAILTGSVPEPAETEPVGCSIKWRGRRPRSNIRLAGGRRRHRRSYPVRGCRRARWAGGSAWSRGRWSGCSRC